VAQEAINNAARHGAPPVRVRYRGGGSWAELEVDDCGAGVPAGAAEAAERTGHLGLMNMTQRAEAIGAELSVGRRPGGGTRVRLVWEGAAEPASGAAKTVGRAAEAVEPGAEPAAEPA
jgi:signal transduction histidine kinase